LFPHLYLIDLNSFPYRYILCSQIFRTTFWLNLQLEDPFWIIFWILPEQFSQISLNGTPAQNIFFSLSHHLTFVLYSSGRSWNYFLCMQTFWVALYSGVCLILVGLLLPYQ
jgi:hypothetical protein